MKNKQNSMENKIQNKHNKCLREEREAGAQVERQVGGAPHLVAAPREESY